MKGVVIPETTRAAWWKVPFREVYCENAVVWIKATIWCHLVLRLFPHARENAPYVALDESPSLNPDPNPYAPPAPPHLMAWYRDRDPDLVAKAASKVASRLWKERREASFPRDEPYRPAKVAAKRATLELDSDPWMSAPLTPEEQAAVLAGQKDPGVPWDDAAPNLTVPVATPAGIRVNGVAEDLDELEPSSDADPMPAYVGGRR